MNPLGPLLAAIISRSILLVDEEDPIRKAIETILNRMGIDVESAANGAEALQLFQINPGKYDLVVTDQSMPKMSGVELTKAIRKDNPEVPIILSTGQLGLLNVAHHYIAWKEKSH